MKKLFTLTALLLLPAAVSPAQESDRYRTTGAVSVGGLGYDDGDADSSKLQEYRDLSQEVFAPGVRLDLFDTQTGRFLEVSAANAPRDDMDLAFRAGGPGTWSVEGNWTGIPHLLSNKALSPYTYANGRLDVPATIPITFKKLGTAAADTPGVVASDLLMAAFAQRYASPVDLGTQRDRGRLAARFSPAETVQLRLGYRRTEKTGSQVGYGPIGDRPPRTLNVQFAEPVDWRTSDLRVEAEHVGRRFQAQFAYELSDFEQAIDTLSWRNMYANPATPGALFDTWDRQVATTGQRPLYPDNQFQNAIVTLGLDLPWDSHLSATAAFGRMEQDKELLPYAFHSSALVVQALPRATAEGRIDTTSVRATWSASPTDKLSLRARFGHYGLDNQTPESAFTYVTQDTSNLNGTVTFKNKRVSLAYAYQRQDAGVDLTWRPGFWGSSLGLGWEMDKVDRDYREGDTTENRLVASFRGRPAGWLSLRTGFVYGVRDGGDYDAFVTRQSYWYAPAEAGTDQDNPGVYFSNHPDMRRFDVTDRARTQVDGSLTATRGAVSATASARYRKDDYDDDVVPTQPLSAFTSLADRAATTPGAQLGRLEDERLRYGLDLVYAKERWSVNAFGSYETYESLQRGHEFNENNKGNPGTIQTAELGPWTRATNAWTADISDGSTTLGLGASFTLVPDKVTLDASYSLSRATVALDYAGYGVANWDGTPYADNHQFGFRTPPDRVFDTDVLSLNLGYRVRPNLTVGLGYLFDRYEIADWNQETDTPWYESVGTELLLRDTSRSFQWGNRLFNMGSYLAPDYDAHAGFLTLTYSF